MSECVACRSFRVCVRIGGDDAKDSEVWHTCTKGHLVGQRCEDYECNVVVDRNVTLEYREE